MTNPLQVVHDIVFASEQVVQVLVVLVKLVVPLRVLLIRRVRGLDALTHRVSGFGYRVENSCGQSKRATS